VAKVFFPTKSLYVDAPGHGGTVRYRVARGFEDWSGDSVEVLKVQVEYDQAISGRKSPSYPIEDDDRGWGWRSVKCEEFDRVALAVEELIAPVRSFLITWDREPDSRDISKEIDAVLDGIIATPATRRRGGCSYQVPCRSVRIAKLEGTSALSWGEYFKSELGKLGINADLIRLTIVKIFGDPFMQNPVRS
jgi:hypothetical protein